MHAGIHTCRWLSSSGGKLTLCFFFHLLVSLMLASPSLSFSESNSSTSYMVSAGFQSLFFFLVILYSGAVHEYKVGPREKVYVSIEDSMIENPRMK